MPTLTRFTQIINSTTGNNFTTMLNKCFKQLFKIQNSWLAINKSHRVNTKHTLKLRLCEQVVQNDFWHFTATQLNHNTHTVFIRLITQFGNAFDFFIFHQLCDLFDQTSFVHHVRDFGKDNANFSVFVIFLKMMTGA